MSDPSFNLSLWFKITSTLDLISELEKFFSSNHWITSTRTSRCFFTNLIVLSNDIIYLSLIVKIPVYPSAWRLSSLLLFFICPGRLRRPELKTRTFSCPNLYWSCSRRNCSRKQNRAKGAFALLAGCGPVRTRGIPSHFWRFWRVRKVENVKS